MHNPKLPNIRTVLLPTVNTPKPKYSSWVCDSKAMPVSGLQGT